MDNRDEVRRDVAEYQVLRSYFAQFCAAAKLTLPAGNDYGLEIGTANGNSCDLTILGYPCRIRFDVRTKPWPMLGKLVFERLLPKDEVRCLWTLYFDRQGNADEAPDPRMWSWHLKTTNILDFEVIRLLEEFFKDIAPKPTA